MYVITDPALIPLSSLEISAVVPLLSNRAITVLGV